MRRLPCTCRRTLTTLAVLLLVATSGAEAQTGRVGGIVRDEDGNALKGATVLAENDTIGQSFTATTDDRGRFTMIGLRPGPWRFIALAPGHAAQAADMNVRVAGSLNPPITFALTRTTPPPSAALGNMDVEEVQAAIEAADALFDQRRWDEAAAAYRALLARAPGLTALNLQIAAAHRNRFEYDAAVAAYQEILKIDPVSGKALAGIAATLAEKGDLDTADATLSSAADDPAAGAEVFYVLAEIKARRGQVQEAQRWYQRAADADRGWGKPRLRLGMAAFERGDSETAARFLTQVIAVDPISPEAAEARTVLEKLNR